METNQEYNYTETKAYTTGILRGMVIGMVLMVGVMFMSFVAFVFG